MYFEYGAQETEYLARKDKRLGAAIEQIGHIDRAVDGDLFSSVVHQIVGQQISTKAQETIWQRMQQTLGTVDAGHILAAGVPELQKLGARRSISQTSPGRCSQGSAASRRSGRCRTRRSSGC